MTGDRLSHRTPARVPRANKEPSPSHSYPPPPKSATHQPSLHTSQHPDHDTFISRRTLQDHNPTVLGPHNRTKSNSGDRAQIANQPPDTLPTPPLSFRGITGQLHTERYARTNPFSALPPHPPPPPFPPSPLHTRLQRLPPSHTPSPTRPPPSLSASCKPKHRHAYR